MHSDYSEAISTLRRAITESGREPRTTGECLLSITDMYIHLHQIDEAQKTFETAQEIGPVSRRLRAFLMLTAARLAQARGEDRLAQSGYEEAFELCRKVHASDLALESIAAWSRLVELYSGPEVALRLIADALPDARQAGRMDVVFNLQLVRARSYTRLGQDQLAEVEMRTIRSEAEALGYMTQLTHAFSSLASLAERAGRWPEAINYAKHAIGLAERLGDELLLGHTLAVLCATENRQAAAMENAPASLSADAIAHGERSVEVLAKLPPSDSLVLANSYLAEAYADRHDKAKAAQYYNTAIELVERLQLPWLKEMIVTDLKPKVFAAA